MRLLYGGWGAGLLDGGTRSRVYWVGKGVCMGVYYANPSFVEFRAMMLGIDVYVHIGYVVIDTHPPYKRRTPNVTAYVCFS